MQVRLSRGSVLSSSGRGSEYYESVKKKGKVKGDVKREV
jgi:hypothetical protein